MTQRCRLLWVNCLRAPVGMILLVFAEISLVQGGSDAEYVGRLFCVKCHQTQFEAWAGSHHDLAMQKANETTILGDFNNADFVHNGETNRFIIDNNQFWVEIDTANGKNKKLNIKYTFGIDPLQQYLVEMPGGKLQAFTIAWDSRPQEEGGQRWFHLFPNDENDERNPRNWSGLDQNWNYMCADCHSTNLNKNYDLQTGEFDTTWSEIDVSCEACHGPASEHIKWAELHIENGTFETEDLKGFVEKLNEAGNWIINQQTGLAKRHPQRKANTEVKVCASCHSRRRAIGKDSVNGHSLMDTYQPALLRRDLYYPDGQIRDEVYVYGSFIQSKMFHQGVTCSDCHNPHNLKLRAPGNQLCTRCHQATKFDTRSHHKHLMGTSAAQCTACHMPEKKYMQIDLRGDHSFRVPRPDLSLKLNTPNACTGCHAGRTNQWAAQSVRNWHGDKRVGNTHYGEILFQGKNGVVGADKFLAELSMNNAQPDIVRASAVSLLQRYFNPTLIPTLQALAMDSAPLVRAATLGVVDALPQEVKPKLVEQLLSDPVRAVRVEAARVLADAKDFLTNKQEFNAALQEYVSMQQFNADRAESHVNLGILNDRLKDEVKAETSYKQALEIDKYYAPAYVNLADLYRHRGKESESEVILKRALEIVPTAASVHHAYGLNLVRQKRYDKALESLKIAAELTPNDSHYSYIYAIALDSVGRGVDAMALLEQLQNQYPANREILHALISFNLRAENIGAAAEYAQRLVKLSPWDQKAKTVLAAINAKLN